MSPTMGRMVPNFSTASPTSATAVGSPTDGHIDNLSTITLTRTPAKHGNLFILFHMSESNNEPITSIAGTHDNGWIGPSVGTDSFGDILEIYYAYTDGTGDLD